MSFDTFQAEPAQAPMRDAHATVWLVGAGPGDPELLTRKAVRLLSDCDVVFHDALVGPGVLALIPAGTRLVSVGKRSGRHSKDQSIINRMLADAAMSGQRVVRLKGGDPSIFGRSTEEIAHLRAHGLDVRVCPGITAASAAAASATLSLTRRGVARQLTFVTAHAAGDVGPELDWKNLSSADMSLVVYMGRAAAPEIAARLIAAGRPGSTPVLVALDASLPTERLLHTQLDALAIALLATDREAPATLMIGDGFARDTTCRRHPSSSVARRRSTSHAPLDALLHEGTTS